MKKGLFVLLVILMSGCSEYTEQQESDIAVFERFLSEVTISSDKNTINIASLYQPQDKLFDAVLAIQRNHWSKAIKELTPYAEKKDPDALFWLAQISYGSNPTENIKAGKMMLESAQLGNPYAALMFDPDNITCQRYFSRYCDKKWVSKAKNIFAKQAKKGDVRAIFYTAKFKGDHDVYINAIIDAARQNYYYPIVDYSKEVLDDKHSTGSLKSIAFDLLTYAKNNNFVPAVDMLIYYSERENKVDYRKIDYNSEYYKLIMLGKKLGSNYSWNMSELIYSTDGNNNLFDKHVMAKALLDFNGNDSGLSFLSPITNKDELEIINKKAQEMVGSIPKVIYIDGTHPTVD
ncbi:hypothetical protein [Photobacterium iliopiscarium]|jgi:hypothetical protein|uniref:hypothetical protein n=1 Tax=Photobacterium iliopiscarium TaxID=56192 RepID=UPI000A7620F0|nr:hypothetical protein [Photobacterium iliopiscarium]PST99837.1 hypothetical protein C9I85_09685 [Photobacterium iliopiscarium]PSV85107.1 hypothetical protein C9J51_02185 [Photobacterium iliopiscarium]